MEKPKRSQIYKNKVLDAPYEICIERARYYTQVYNETEGENPSIRAAKALERTLNNMSIYILPEEKLVGNRTSKLVGASIPVERGEFNVALSLDLNNLLKRKQQPFHIDPEDKNELMEEIFPYWEKRHFRYHRGKEMKKRGLIRMQRFDPISLIQRMRNFGLRGLIRIMAPFLKGRMRHIIRGLRELAINNPNIVNNVFDVQGHLVLGVNKIINVGFKGVKKKALKLKEKFPKNSDQSLFLDSVIICCNAVKRFAERFSQLAKEMADKEANVKRTEELLQISKNLAKVPWNPPENFYEAMQFLWFTVDIAMISYGIGGIIAMGRPDQILYPYYKKDIKSENIDETFALELIEELMIKTSYSLLILPSYAKQTASELGADENAITVGGLDKEGNDGTNDLSYLFLDAAINIKNMTNTFSIRVSSKCSEKFLSKIAEVFSKTSGPALFNDDIMIPALMHNGYTVNEARDYGIIGCVEPSSSGNTFSCTSGNDISLAGALELVLNNGKLRMMGKRTGLKTGKLKNFQSFDEILAAYKEQLSNTIEEIMENVNIKDELWMKMYHNPYISLMFEGCLENGMDMTQGGAKYNFASIGGRGIATTADSLLAIKKAVFEDNLISLKELNELLKSNFRGKEEIRQKLINKYPKYGNDDEEADEIVKWVVDTFCEAVTKQKSIRGGCVRPGFFSFGMHIVDGMFIGALPNGRRAGEAVSNSFSPSNGCERNGPTAVIKSYSKIDHEKISNGSSLNLRILPVFLNTDEGKRKLVSLLKSWIDLKGMHIQFNVVDDEVLRDAQIHPELHKDLVVRVSGYCAYFTDLGKPVQEDVIQRYQFQSL
jgi:pyruvate formate-lyase/glycerol dehydratase family glycyl radical enzyme